MKRQRADTEGFRPPPKGGSFESLFRILRSPEEKALPPVYLGFDGEKCRVKKVPLGVPPEHWLDFKQVLYFVW